MRSTEKDSGDYRIVAGIVTGTTGVVTAGTGFTTSRTSTGIWSVRFTEPFKALFACTATPTGGGFAIFYVDSHSPESVRVVSYLSTTGAVVDQNFQFIATGIGIR